MKIFFVLILNLAFSPLVSVIIPGMGKIHPWVNYESILQKCLVGRLVKNKPVTQEDLSKAFFEGLSPPSTESKKMTWHQTLHKITFRISTDASLAHVLVRYLRDNHIRILVRVKKILHVFSFSPSGDLKWPCGIDTNTGKVDILFDKSSEGCWDRFGLPDPDHCREISDDSEFEDYFSAEIVAVKTVTHNCALITLKIMDRTVLWVPVGHDVRVRGIVEGTEITRRYTPTCAPSASAPTTSPDCLNFLVKYYTNGALTPYIFRKNVGDVIDVGGPGGDFDTECLSTVENLYLVAAGTGITPISRLITWALVRKNVLSAIKLLFVNREEKDIIWREEFDKLAVSEPKFTLQYCLSRPGEKWDGWTGRLSEDHLNKFVPLSATVENGFVAVCGPIGFTNMVKRILDGRGWSDNSHYFIG